MGKCDKVFWVLWERTVGFGEGTKKEVLVDTSGNVS